MEKERDLEKKDHDRALKELDKKIRAEVETIQSIKEKKIEELSNEVGVLQAKLNAHIKAAEKEKQQHQKSQSQDSGNFKQQNLNGVVKQNYLMPQTQNGSQPRQSTSQSKSPQGHGIQLAPNAAALL